MAERREFERLFQNPAAQYRGLPFWSWNCAVTEELIDEQLNIFKEMGFGGVTIHARTGLDTPYLGEDYLRLTRYAVEKCKEKGLLCWLYDDDRFPSGAADGLVTADWHYRQRFLLLTERERTDFCADKQAFDQALDAGERPAGWYAASYAVGAGSARRLKEGEALRPGEKLRRGYVALLEGEDWFQGQTYADVLNPEAVRRFIDLTHEAYFRLLGDDFGDAVPAIFTDEPRMKTRTNRYPGQLPDPDSSQDVIIPWSDALRERLRLERGLDLLDMAPALIWELPDSAYARYHFRDAACEQFVSAFMDQIGKWCLAHHIRMTGHVLSEDNLHAQAVSLGECMRCYRGMTLPGIDVLCDDRQFLAVKQAASVAHQYGREGVASELYGVTEWNCDFKTFKLQGDWQAALGITHRVPHLSWMSMEGEAKRDWPGSIFYQAPWWREYRAVEDYFARLNTALTRGTSMIHTAVIHPVESMWLHLGNDADSRRSQQEMDARFAALIEGLLTHFADFDLISEALLPNQAPFCDEGGLHVGGMVYRTVILPDMETVRSTTLEVLEAFRRQGGRVIFTGRIPAMADAIPSSRALNLALQCERTNSPEELYACLENETALSVRFENGGSAENLLSQRRRDGDAEWLFLCHAYPSPLDDPQRERYEISIKGIYKAVRYDPMTGDCAPMAAVYEDGCTLIPWRCYGEDSLLLRLEKGEAQKEPLPEKQYRPWLTTLCPGAVSLMEPNMLLLDYARARLDGGPVTEKTEILRLDNEIRKRLGFKLRCGSMMQPYALEEKDPHALTLYYAFESQTEIACELGLEHPERCRLVFNGEAIPIRVTGWYVDKAIQKIALPPLRKGTNTLELSMPYHQKTNLECLYLLGDFDVLKRPAGESAILEKREKKHLGDLTAQGMPFYSGVCAYSFSFEAREAGSYALRVPKFSAAVLTAHLDGRALGQIAYAPHMLPLGPLSAGSHQLEIRAFIGRHNGFGYLHNCADPYRWYGPDAWRTVGEQWTDDYCLKPAGILSPLEILREAEM